MKGMRGCYSWRLGASCCAFRVANGLGPGFVEKIYENALAHEMRKSGFGVVQQQGIVAFYDDVIIGEYTADLIVEDQVIIELKVVPVLSDVHLPQCRACSVPSLACPLAQA